MILGRKLSRHTATNWTSVGNVVCYVILGMGFFIRLWVLWGVKLFQEDALITLRYGRNLWQGNGPVFNLGERVLGVTSPLWTIITAPIIGLFDYDLARVLLGILGLVLYLVTSLIWLRLLRAWEFSFVALYVFVILQSFHPALVSLSVSGMEAPLFVLWITLSILAVHRENYPASGAMAALALLTRPEGAIWIGCLLFYLAITKRTIPWKELLIILIILLPWVVFATIYYGSPLPQSMVAKTNWISNDLTMGSFLWRPAGLLRIWTETNGISFRSLPVSILVGLAILWFLLIGMGMHLAWRRRLNSLLLCGIFFLSYFLFFYLGNARFFEWYWYPSIILSAAIVALAIGDLIQKLARASAKRFRSPYLQAGVTVVLLLGLTCAVGGTLVYKIAGFLEQQRYEDTARRPTGEYLAECTRLETRVMLEPIGYIGFFSKRTIIDLAGLISPEFASNRLKQTPGWVIEKMRVLHPEIIVLREYEIRRNSFFASDDFPIFADASTKDWFLQNYSAMAKFGEGASAMVIWRRFDVQSTCSSE